MPEPQLICTVNATMASPMPSLKAATRAGFISSAMMLWTAPPTRHQVPKRGRRSATKGRPSMERFIRTAIDLGKNYFQVHGLESEGGRSISRKVKRSKMHEVYSQIE